ncbi:unnamed protein product [Zymoseptoria tritici ST99CH_1A5]|uniref:Uncharacterized protein n=1 Tax=Zymoseptoria tritici ST99CH_1A5 TaxID=1276529 RepID=A0A1Y6L6T7_ZYMTR|nr:unnamed protein product [Zymoseptoria tritici ST99CH_1A5]
MERTTPSIPRNGQNVLNPAHFSPDGLSHRARARGLLQEITASPLDEQVRVTQDAIGEDSKVAPYLFFEATRLGLVSIARAVVGTGQVVVREMGQRGWENAVESYEEGRRKEVLGAEGDSVHRELEKWLEEAQYQEEEEDHLLFEAAVAGNVKVVEILLAKRGEERPVEPLVLHAAAHDGRLDVVRVLLGEQGKMDINGVDKYGGTALMRAAVGGSAEVVKCLLEHGADAGLRETSEGRNWNALEFGAGQRGLEIVKLLLGPCGFSPDALRAAASFGDEEAFDMILKEAGLPDPPLGLEKGGLWWFRDHLTVEQQEMVLGVIEQGGSGGCVEILQKMLAYIPQFSGGNMPAVLEALRSSAENATLANHPSTLLLLLSYLIRDTNNQSDTDKSLVTTLLLTAACSNALLVVPLLIDTYHGDINALHATQLVSALFIATAEGHAEMVRLLAGTYNADLHQSGGKFANGPTPLWLAIDRQDEEVARVLLSLGGPVESIDRRIELGKTKRVWVSRSTDYRAPVKVVAEMDPGWDDEQNEERFLCLVYPEGWFERLRMRKTDAELKDERPLKERGGWGLRRRVM